MMETCLASFMFILNVVYTLYNCWCSTNIHFMILSTVYTSVHNFIRSYYFGLDTEKLQRRYKTTTMWDKIKALDFFVSTLKFTE